MQTTEKILSFIMITFLFLLLNPLFSITLNSDYDTFKEYYLIFTSILSLMGNLFLFVYKPRGNYEYIKFIYYNDNIGFIYLFFIISLNLIISLNVLISLVFIGIY